MLQTNSLAPGTGMVFRKTKINLSELNPPKTVKEAKKKALLVSWKNTKDTRRVKKWPYKE